MTLIDRLRTGKHEQAVWLLRECFDVLLPSPEKDGSPVSYVMGYAWARKEANFHPLLSIGTPEACVGAAMMLMPEEWSHVIREGFVELRHPTNSTKDVTGISASTALALAAAIIEARNG